MCEEDHTLVRREIVAEHLRRTISEAVSAGVLTPEDLTLVLENVEEPPLDCDFIVMACERRRLEGYSDVYVEMEFDAGSLLAEEE